MFLSLFDGDFLENMEDFVTLDELAEDEEEGDGQKDGGAGTAKLKVDMFLSVCL